MVSSDSVAMGNKKCWCIKDSDGPSYAWPSLSQCRYFQPVYDCGKFFYTRHLENDEFILGLSCYLIKKKKYSWLEKRKKENAKNLEGKFDEIISDSTQ